MIYIYMKRGEEGVLLEAYGHANHGAIGCDIVCAGVSALLYGLTAYLETQAESYPEGRLEISESDGRLYVKTERLEGQETAFAVTAAGLELIMKAFPEAVCFTPLSGGEIREKEERNGRRVDEYRRAGGTDRL